MRDYNEFCDEIKRRKEKLIQKKKQKKRIITTCISMAVCLSVVATFPWDIFAPPRIGDGESESFKNSDLSIESEAAPNSPSYNGGGSAENNEMIEEAESAASTNPAYDETVEEGAFPETDYVDGIAGNETVAWGDDDKMENLSTNVSQDETKEELGTGSIENEICGYIIVQNAAGENFRYAEVSDCSVFIEMLKNKGIELIYGNETEDTDETAAENVTTNLQRDVSEETAFVATEWDSYEVESFDESETFTADYENESIEIESEVAGEKVTASGGNSSREKIIFIEIVCSDYEKWVFSCSRGEYEILYYRLEELFTVYEVK